MNKLLLLSIAVALSGCSNPDPDPVAFMSETFGVDFAPERIDSVQYLDFLGTVASAGLVYRHEISYCDHLASFSPYTGRAKFNLGHRMFREGGFKSAIKTFKGSDQILFYNINPEQCYVYYWYAENLINDRYRQSRFDSFEEVPNPRSRP